ncbi:MAG TPA: carboxymuconolactone decarboxylase family protein [Polyangiaceae bacterium]|nr:carboxymuconolactone decarboxylase family protein [Polyangiaceae bacterium]
MEPRIQPKERPYPEDMETTLARLMPPGVEPLLLFRVLARDPRLFRKFMAGGLLDRGTLSLREREIAIDRTTARTGAEYEWGVHVAVFGPRVGIGDAEQRAIVEPGADAPCWAPNERLIVRLMDQLHDHADVDDALFAELRETFTEEQVLELLLLAGFYRTVSYLVKGLRLPLESFGAKFPEPSPQ